MGFFLRRPSDESELKMFLGKNSWKTLKETQQKPTMELRNGSEMNITLWQRAVPSEIIRQTLRARTHEMKWKTWLREFWLGPLFPHPPSYSFSDGHKNTIRRRRSQDPLSQTLVGLTTTQRFWCSQYLHENHGFSWFCMGSKNMK